MHLIPLRIAFLGIALLSAIGNSVVPLVLRSIAFESLNDQWDAQTVWIGVLDGLVIGEFVAIAVWILFDDLFLIKKLLMGTFFGFVLAACLVFGIQVWPGMPVQFAVTVLLIGSALPGACTGLLYGVARLISPDTVRSTGAAQSERSRQYGIASLFGLMIMVALVITIARAIMPVTTAGGWTTWDAIRVLLWFAWVAVGVTVFVWFPIALVSQPSLFYLISTFLLALLGPSFFYWISMVAVTRTIGFSDTFFPVFPQCMSVGLLVTSLVLGCILRFCAVKRPAVEAAMDSAMQD